MPVLSFPPVSQADSDGLLAVGGDLDVDSLLCAYRSGIFPWPVDQQTLLWFAPPERAVLFVEEFHIPRRLHRAVRSGSYESRFNTSFREVITLCAEVKNRGSQQGTWITSDVIEAYCRLHEAGYCHSFETYFNGELVGGLYGVQIGRFFAAESSFYRKTDASKIAMCSLADYLRSQRIPWFDCQVITPFSKSFGARNISRNEFMRLLESVLL